MVFMGLFLSIFFAKDTAAHAAKEAENSSMPLLNNVFVDTTWKNKNLGSVTQAGLVNNLNDGMVWGIMPIMLIAKGYSLGEVGLVTAVYPAVWGVGQLITGKMADWFCEKKMLFIGMVLQAIALLLLIWASSLISYVCLAALLGWGTAMVYPTFLATVAENTHPKDRPKSIGIFRLWRDLGYAIGALLTGIIADLVSINAAVVAIGMLTLGSALIINHRMKCL